MNYLISSYSVNPYHGSEDGVGWNWVIQYNSNWNEGDRIILLTKKYNENDTRKGLIEFDLKHIELVIVDVPDYLNWFREKYSMFHHMYYILWQHYAYKWLMHSGISFDVIHHVTMGDYRIPGEMYKFRTSKTIFGPVGGAQVTPKALECYEKSIFTAYFRKFVNRLCNYNPFYLRAIRSFSAVYASNVETFQQISKIRRNLYTKQIVELAVTDEMKYMQISRRNNNDKIKLLYVGRLIEKKGVIFLLEIAKLLSEKIDFQLDIIGGGYLEDYMCNYIKQNSLEGNINIIGQIKHNEIINKYMESDLFILPSLRETGGTVLIEAMASGLPIVSFNTSFCVELKTNNCGIFVDTFQPLTNIKDDFCSAITELAQNPELRHLLGNNGWRFVNQTLTWEKKFETVVKYVELEKIEEI